MYIPGTHSSFVLPPKQGLFQSKQGAPFGFQVYIYIYEYRTKVPNTQIRFRWTSCRGTMHRTLITDRGRPKNRYPYNLSVRVSCAKPVGLRIVSLQSCNQLACLQLIATLQFLTYSIIFAVSPTDTPTDTNRYPKAMTNLLGNPYLRPLFCQHQMDQVHVCLVSLSMHFIHVVCLTVSLFLFPLSKLMGKCSKASKEEQCGIRRLRSKMQAASRRCRHSTNKCFQKSKHN